MKRLFRFIFLAILALIIFVSINVVRFNSVQPKPFSDALPEVSDSSSIHLSKAIKFKTIAHKIEMMDKGQMEGLHDFLKSTYPEFHAKAELEIVSSHTLLYKWKGSDKALKPIMYLGHMDVVPVEKATINNWEAKPFSGEIKDGFIYGRGALDDKGTVIGLLEAAEMLAVEGFKPQRTIYILFGQDEEISGHEGAKIVAKQFEENNIELEMIWDEGTVIGKNMVPGFPNEVGLIGIAEKGYASFVLSSKMEGGHSSIPENNSAISNITKAITALHENQFPYRIAEPVEGFIEYMGPVSPALTKMAFANPWLFKSLIYKSYAKTGSGRALIRTTMAPTIVKGGVKDNVVPTRAQAVINCRILPGESVESVEAHIIETIGDTNVVVKVLDTKQDPSPSSDYRNEYFNTLGGVVRTVYPDAYVTPFLMLGATDSRHFNKLCNKIYKFAPFSYRSEDLARLHGVNERISEENFKKGIQIYYLSIKHLDQVK